MQVYRALNSFRAAVDKDHPRGRLVNAGDLIAENDPIFKDRRHLFEPIDEAIERATATPGEKRTTRRRDSSKEEEE